MIAAFLALHFLWCIPLAMSGAFPDPVTFPWWNDSWTHRVKVSVKALQDEHDFPIDVRLSFSNYFSHDQSFGPSSVRVVEQDATTGAVVGECPAVFLPTDATRRSFVPASRPALWLSNPPQKARATSEAADHPAANAIDEPALFGGKTWQGGDQPPPWILAADLGSPQSVNCVLVRYPGHGGMPGQPVDAVVEVSADSPDGLTQGKWEKVGGWKNAANGRLYNVPRIIWFAPRKVRYVRLVVTRSVNGPPEVEDFQVRWARYDPATRAEGTVHWVASGGLSANKERVFFIYFDKLAQASPETAGPADRMSALPIARFGLFREAEDAADYTCPTGWCFGTNTIEGASGPKNPNALSVAVHPQKYLYWDNAGFPVTIPSSGSYALTLRVRSDPGDHEFEILVDNESVRKGKLTFGDGWTMATVPDLSLSQGVHSLEVFLMNGKERPLDFDCLWLTNYAEFQPKGFLQCSVGQGEVKP